MWSRNLNRENRGKRRTWVQKRKKERKKEEKNTVMFTITVLDLVVVTPRCYMPYIAITMRTHRPLIGRSNPHIL
jgi:hypothetical protein